MLAMPEHGFQPSVKKHNVNLEIATDWVEASVEFMVDRVSQGDVVDILQENGVYRDQDFAAELVSDIWLELKRRQASLGNGAPFEIRGRTVRRLLKWRSVPAYSFCLLVSLQAWYRQWALSFGQDYTEQGALFERLTAECLECTGWDVHTTGWRAGNASKIRTVVASLTNYLNEHEITGAIDEWVSEHANEEGLDLVCSNPFPDERGGRPIFLFQCASGADWDTKLHTPDPDVWRRIISFTTVPQRGFALPFGLLDKDFRRRAGAVNGFLLDRYRLLSPSYEGRTDWVSPSLQRNLKTWLTPRVRDLPRANE